MTALDLDAIEARWSADGGMGNGRSADDYTDSGCRVLAQYAFVDIPALVAVLRERDNTITRVRELIDTAPHLHDPWADDWKGEQVVPVDRLRAALDPQETP